MGHASTLRYACTLSAIAFLTGCNSSPTDIDALRAQVEAQRVQIAALQSDLEITRAELREEINGVRALGLENASNAAALTETFNSNVDLSNQEKVAAMTRRGACGTELVPVYSQTEPKEQIGVQNRVIPCTLQDLKPAK